MSTTTTWGIKVDLQILSNNVVIESSAENPKKFTLKKFEINRQNLTNAFADLGVTLPDDLFKAIPENTFIQNLIVDGSKNPTQVEFEVGTQFSEEFILNKFDKFLTIENTRMYFKLTED